MRQIARVNVSQLVTPSETIIQFLTSGWEQVASTCLLSGVINYPSTYIDNDTLQQHSHEVTVGWIGNDCGRPHTRLQVLVVDGLGLPKNIKSVRLSNIDHFIFIHPFDKFYICHYVQFVNVKQITEKLQLQSISIIYK